MVCVSKNHPCHTLIVVLLGVLYCIYEEEDTKNDETSNLKKSLLSKIEHQTSHLLEEGKRKSESQKISRRVKECKRNKDVES